MAGFVKLVIACAAVAICARSQTSDLTRAELAIQDAIQAGDLTTASRLIRDTLQHHPNEGGLFNLRGIVHAQRKEMAEAHNDFAEAVHLKPDLTAGWQNLARVCQQEADVSSLACAADAWNHVLRLKPDDPEAHAALLSQLRQLAVDYERLGRPDDARKTLERLAVEDPDNTSHLLELARLAEMAKDHEGALGYLAHARDLQPDNPQIHFLFAMVAFEMNLPIEARRSLDRALALDPANPDYNYGMGSVILTTRDAATAARYFQKFIEAKPADPRGHYALGVAYFASGDYEKAKEQMLRVEHNPKTAGGAEYFLGRIAHLEEQLDDAVQHLRKSIELVPSSSEPHTQLARVLMSQGKLEEAHAELDRAIALDPNSFLANEQLLVLYKRTHDSRANQQAALLKQLDEDRSKRAELMLRTIEARP